MSLSVPASPPKPQSGFFGEASRGLTLYYFTTLIVSAGVLLGHDFLQPPQGRPALPTSLLSSYLHWDGQHYKEIAEHGYFYDPDRASSVAFFPAYPLCTRFLMMLTGWGTETALLVVAHCFLLADFTLFSAYTRRRFPQTSRRVTDFTLLAFALFPVTFFFRMAYTEAMFVFLVLLALDAMEKGWSLFAIAFVIGLATATRPVGIALIPPFLTYIVRNSAGRRALLKRSLALLPVAGWGLLAYVAYQAWAFHAPFAFAQTQENFRVVPPTTWPNKLLSLILFEPLWGPFTPGSRRYWAFLESHESPAFSFAVANPLFFVSTAVLVTAGALRRWLTATEVVLSAGLLLIPYVTRGYENSMLSMGRFAAVVVPVYIVLGHILARLPVRVAVLLLGLSAFFLGVYSALFSAGYMVF